MTRNEQRAFVRDLCRTIESEVRQKITEGRIPKEWDGVELRMLLADKFTESAFPDRVAAVAKRDYRNTRAIKNI